MDNTPPEDSIFNLPPYKASQFSNSSTNVQMDPIAAMQQTQAKFTVARIIRGVSAAVLTLAAVAGGAWYMLSTASSTQASIDLKHALLGNVATVSVAENSFTLSGAKSEDPSILATGVTNWTIQLPPGTNLGGTGEQAVQTCYTISSFEHNFNEALPVSCINFLHEGSKAVVEYVIMKPEAASMVAKKIIREE